MARRFNRDYELRVKALGGDVTIRPPMRVGFQADKSTRGQLNKMQVQLYNLEERKRLALVKDAEDSDVIPIQLSVGYEGRLETVFIGTIHTGRNAREGADIITTIEALDGGHDFLNAFTSRTIGAGQSPVEVVFSDMQRVSQGKITKRPVLTRPKVMVGNSIKLVEDTIGPDETWYIDDEQLYIIRDDEVTSRFIPSVNAKTGLISTPTRENKEVTFLTLLNPSIKIGQRAYLQSTTAPHLDGVYRIDTISYQGDNYGDEWSQTCTGQPASGAVVL